ncbi:MAG: helix-turn-helix domain-containing protein [Promethearchaeota archaeon]
MNNQIFSFLNEIGFSDIQINIYKFLLIHKFGTINDIKNELNYSYAQVYNNLLYLEQQELIETNPKTKPKLYIRKNPKLVLIQLLNRKYRVYENLVEKLDNEINIQESKFGRCLKDVTFYYYSDIALGIENLITMIQNSEKEIIITALPLLLVKKLELALYNAFTRGIEIKLYFSESDFEFPINYFNEIVNILHRVRIQIIETKEKTCQVVRFNDDIVNMGNIFIDEIYLNSILFQENETLAFDGHYNPNIIKQVKNYLELKTVLKKVEIEYPESIKNVLKIIEDQKSIKTRDLSSKSKIGGAKLREILDFLIKEGAIQEELIQGERAGRPKRVYSMAEENL